MTRGRTLYLRGLPEPLVREAKATAARRGITLAALVAEALRQVVDTPPATGGKPEGARASTPTRRGGRAAPRQRRPADLAPASEGAAGAAAASRAAGLAESMRWFQANRRRLLRRYRDQYVAIDRGRVIDHDRDFDALARRVFARVGTRPVFMPKVTAEDRILAVPSPRLVGA
ncbi:MAG: DUF5678 domain-containing protein [Armatimonadota bacterium]|nr:DUF5678 domain-containing protein [Armatimonadota bacterium]